MKSDDREAKIKKLEEQRNKAIKSLTDYKESNLPVSAAAEYLTFVAGSGESSVEVRYQDENIWLTQKMMAELYGVDRSVITKHLKKVFLDDELEEDSVCAIFAHTASDEKTYKVKFYALQAVIAVGFKIDNQRAVQFRKWIITIAKNYTIKGFDVDRAFESVVKSGAQAVMTLTTEPWGQRTCYIADPEGNLIEIGSFKEE